MPLDFLACYDVSKAGVIALTQAIAMYMARSNVNVNSLCPGIIKTEMGVNRVHLLSASHLVFRGMDSEEVSNTPGRNSLRKRPPQTAEGSGNDVVFLASDGGKEIMGQGINGCGGMYLS